MGNCEVLTKVDTGSDHRMVRARIEINKKIIKLKKIQKQKTLKLHIGDLLEKLATPFRIELKSRFDALKDKEPTIEKISKILTKSVDTLHKKTQKFTIKRVLKIQKLKA